MLPDLKPHFSCFVQSDYKRLHFAAHSHHYWPDVTFEAQQQCWLDAARLADDKWEPIFSDLIPAVQSGIAGILKLPDPKSIVFAPNTHELVLRLLSCFPPDRKIKILTTDAEFYSFRRQAERLAEEDCIEITRVATQPFDTFAERFCMAAQGSFDLVFLSHVFFDSGFAATPLEKIAASVASQDTFIVIDGYHAFMALPTDLSKIADRVFYLGGGYKYAMAGEGACFMHCPPGYGLRPRNTGWFAEMDSLAAQKSGKVDYAAGGGRFFGSTFDASGLYRMRAVLDWLKGLRISVADIHAHIHGLQKQFMNELKHPDLDAKNLLVPLQDERRGHFLTFRTEKAAELKEKLRKKDIIVDHRGDRLRFGFGIYHDDKDVTRLTEALRDLA